LVGIESAADGQMKLKSAKGVSLQDQELKRERRKYLSRNPVWHPALASTILDLP